MDPMPALHSGIAPDPEILPDVANDLDRRGHARNVKVMRVARLKDMKLHAEYLGLVRDVSPGGMMIDADFPLEIGQSVAVALLDDQELTGDVVWIDGKTVGIQFDEPIAVENILAKPSIKANGRRARHPRFKVNKSVVLRLADQNIQAMLQNISQRGAMLICSTKTKLHSNILLRMNRDHAVRATIKWRTANLMGVEFHRLLSVEELGIWLKEE